MRRAAAGLAPLLFFPLAAFAHEGEPLQPHDLWTAWSFERIVLIAAIAFLPLVPVLVLVSRVLWIHMDQAFDPER